MDPKTERWHTVSLSNHVLLTICFKRLGCNSLWSYMCFGLDFLLYEARYFLLQQKYQQFSPNKCSFRALFSPYLSETLNCSLKLSWWLDPQFFYSSPLSLPISTNFIKCCQNFSKNISILMLWHICMLMRLSVGRDHSGKFRKCCWLCHHRFHRPTIPSWHNYFPALNVEQIIELLHLKG